MNYTNQLWKLMRKEMKDVPPVMIYGKSGYRFNGVNYGQDKETAYKARREYFLKIKK